MAGVVERKTKYRQLSPDELKTYMARHAAVAEALRGRVEELRAARQDW